MNIQFVKLYRTDNSNAYDYNASDYPMSNLGCLLHDIDSKDSLIGVIKSLCDNQFPGFSTNMTFVDADGDYVEIRDSYYDEELYTEETLPYLRIHRDELVRIFRAWLEFITNRGQEFLVTLENSKACITTKIDTQKLIPHTLVAKAPNTNPFATIYVKDNAYRSESNDIPLNNLANFLSGMKNVDALSRCIEFAYANQYYGMLSKSTIAHRDGDYINIRTPYYDTTVYSEETIPYLHIYRDEFARILNVWLQFIRSGDKEFFITLEDGKIQITTPMDYH